IPDDATRNALTGVFNYLMRNASLGESNKATNFAWFKVTGTTHATANTEFSVAHGLATIPTKFIPILGMDAVGNGLVPLTVSRLPDTKRLYFTSASTNVTFTGFVE